VACMRIETWFAKSLQSADELMSLGRLDDIVMDTNNVSTRVATRGSATAFTSRRIIARQYVRYIGRVSNGKSRVYFKAKTRAF